MAPDLDPGPRPPERWVSSQLGGLPPRLGFPRGPARSSVPSSTDCVSVPPTRRSCRCPSVTPTPFLSKCPGGVCAATGTGGVIGDMKGGREGRVGKGAKEGRREGGRQMGGWAGRQTGGQGRAKGAVSSKCAVSAADVFHPVAPTHRSLRDGPPHGPQTTH